MQNLVIILQFIIIDNLVLIRASQKACKTSFWDVGQEYAAFHFGVVLKGAKFNEIVFR